MSATISSAVALPEDAQQPLSVENGLKRRLSDALEQEQEQEQDPKRKRISPGKTSPTAGTGDENGIQVESKQDNVSRPPQQEEIKATRRKSGVADEKQRSKRLFGALLGNLNQPGDRVSKRRTEIEQRRKAELQKQDDERLEDRQRRLERLATKRKNEQINVDERNMRTRHQNLLDAANFLYTRAEPKLYYRPWDLLPDEEDRIDDQVKEAQAKVDSEIAEWEEEKRKRLQELATEMKIASGEDAAPNASEKGTAEELVVSTQDEVVERDVIPLEPAIASQPINSIAPEADDLDASARLETQDGTATVEHEAIESNAEGTHKPHAESEEQVEGETKEDAEDEEGHVEEGDEDTVIY